MQYATSYYWQPNDTNVTTLVLQQAYHKKKRMPVILACICTEEQAQQNHQRKQRMAKDLADWFYGRGLPLCSKLKRSKMDEITDSLNICLQQSLRKEEPNHVAGIFCVGAHFQLFQKGRQNIGILNSLNYHSHYRNLAINQEKKNSLSIQSGVIQKGVGILLASESFCTSCSYQNIEECLNIQQLHSQSRVDKHLQELGTFGEKKGGNNMGAILLVSR